MTLTAVINPLVPLNLLFPHQRVICPHSRLSAKYRIVTHNFTNENLTDGNSPSYHLVVAFSKTLEVEWISKDLKILRIHRRSNSPYACGQIIGHDKTTSSEGLLFEIFCILYIFMTPLYLDPDSNLLMSWH